MSFLFAIDINIIVCNVICLFSANPEALLWQRLERLSMGVSLVDCYKELLKFSRLLC